MESNQITLRGRLSSLPQFSHESHNKRFYRFLIQVSRLSGAVDTLPVLAEEQLLADMQMCENDLITLWGQIRSHNLRDEFGKRRLLVFVFANAISASQEDVSHLNDVTLTGRLCREPVFRRTPLGRDICDIMLAVSRGFQRADYLPCILWGKIARQAAQCTTGDAIQIYGRMQSRTYTKLTAEGAVEKTTYEISALSAEFFPTEPE